MMEILFSILDCVEIFLFFYIFDQLKCRRKLIVIPIVILFGYFNYVVSNLTNLYDFNIEILLSLSEVIMLYCCFEKIKGKDLILLFLLNIISLVEVFGFLLVEQSSAVIQFDMYTFSICVHLLRVLTFYLFAKYVKNFIGKYGTKSMSKIFFTILPLLILMLLLLQGYYLFGHVGYYNLILATTIVVGFSIFMMVKQLYITEYENDKLKMFEKMISYSTLQYREQEEKAKEIRKIKHDIISNLGIIQCLINENKYEESTAYITKIIGESKAIDTRRITKHQYLNALLKYKMNSFGDIAFEYQIDSLEMAQEMEFDCCTIVTNLLDNAIDELNRNLEHNRQITVRIKERNNNIIIIVENDVGEYKTLMSQKRNKEEHGFGLSIVETIVKKYNGEIRIEQNERFKVSLFLKKPCEIDDETAG